MQQLKYRSVAIIMIALVSAAFKVKCNRQYNSSRCLHFLQFSATFPTKLRVQGVHFTDPILCEVLREKSYILSRAPYYTFNYVTAACTPYSQSDECVNAYRSYTLYFSLIFNFGHLTVRNTKMAMRLLLL